MQQDYLLIKDILTVMADHNVPVMQSQQLLTELDRLYFNSYEKDIDKRYQLYLHLQLLEDSKCIKKAGSMILNTTTKQNMTNPQEAFRSKRIYLDIGFSYESNNGPQHNHDLIRLTKDGYDLLTSLENDKVMDEVKKTGGKIAIESVIAIATTLGTAALTKIIGS